MKHEEAAEEIYDQVVELVHGLAEELAQEHGLTSADVNEMAWAIIQRKDEAPVERYSPIEDDRKEYTLQEWIATIRNELSLYEMEWVDTNDFHKDKHTWSEWHNTLIRYMSF